MRSEGAHNEPKPAPGVRVWPVPVILLVGCIAWLRIWSNDAADRSYQVLGSILVTGVVLLLLIVWWTLFSRLRWKVRLVGLGGLLVLALVLVGSLRVRDLSGDLMPILGWRWTADDRPSASEEAEISDRQIDRHEVPPTGRPSEFPQYLGPDRNGEVRGIELGRDWQATPPEEIWRRDVGAGWSGVAVASGLAVTQEQYGPEETVRCYDAATGALRWSHADLVHHETGMGGVGPRATPSISDGRVFAQGATGILNALDLVTGQRLWSVDIVADNGASKPTHGVAASPLVMNGQVVVLAGGGDGKSLVAYDAETGRRLWSGGDNGAHYSSPMLTSLAGVAQILVFANPNLSAHDPATGEVLWQQRWPQASRASQPVPLDDDLVFTSTGYGIGGRLFRIERDTDGRLSSRLVWKTPRLKAKFTNVVSHQGYLYGLDEGVLVCLDPENGERKWKRGRYGHGQTLLIGDLLLVVTEKGEVMLLEANPQEHRELGSFQAVRGKTWNPPALAGPHLFVRNATEMACYKLPTVGFP